MESWSVREVSGLAGAKFIQRLKNRKPDASFFRNRPTVKLQTIGNELRVRLIEDWPELKIFFNGIPKRGKRGKNTQQ